MSTAKENEQIARTGYDAYNARDFERGAANVADDGELTAVPFGASFHGKEGFKQFLQGWASAFPDSKVEVTYVVADDNGFAAEFTARGTHTGPMQTPNGVIPPTGKKIEVRYCDVATIKNGKIKSLHTYFDAATFMRQLGLA